ncbi:hypothetical protein PYW07_003775 [Mythimna separata]|uniref:IML9 n=1 Tax=Mythimna separata TaxID=271217 RepID=A0A8F3C7G3_MYTSE|nr:hypothetical protein PYW07_003775 [Mythimna separata]QWY13106.1 IML9 [Mythimna separata]
MFSKAILVLLIVYHLPNLSHGIKDNKFFRYDYHYIESSGSFYKFHVSQQNWRDAKRVCAREGASLFYPQTDDEAQDVIAFWNSTQPDYSQVFVGISSLMVGGVFETIDGKLDNTVYNNWEDGHPDYSYNCVCLSNGGHLQTYSCTNSKAFICKKTLRSLQWDYECNMSKLGYIFNKDTGKCYKLHATPLNWKDAYTACRLEQSSLAIVNGRKELEFLAKLTESAAKLRLRTNYLRGIFHLGFHNQDNECWQTVKGTPLSDANTWWGNYQADVDDEKKCGSMFYTGRLTHVNCDTKSFFICEHEVKTVTSLRDDTTSPKLGTSFSEVTTVPSVGEDTTAAE